MTIHSRTYHQALATDMTKNMPVSFQSPRPLKRTKHRSDQQSPIATDLRNASNHHFDLDIPHKPFPENMRPNNAAHEQLIVDAFRSGEAHNILLIDSDALNPAEFAMLEKLNALGLSLPIQQTVTEESELSPRTEFGNLRFDFKICRAYWKGHAVDLTITQFNIVRLFAERSCENLTYREIYDVVHGEGFFAGEGTNGYQTNVRSLIKRIRQKFCEIDDTFDAIENHRGFGYRWQEPDDTSHTVQADITVKEGSNSHHEHPTTRSLVLMVLLARNAQEASTP